MGKGINIEHLKYDITTSAYSIVDMNRKQILSLANKVGLSDKLISTYDRLTGNLQNIYPGDEICSYNSKSHMHDERVLFLLVPGHIQFRRRHSVLGHAFRVRGYQPIFLYNDDDLPAKVYGATQEDHEQINADIRGYRVKQILESFGFEACSLGEVLTSHQKASIFNAESADELLRLSNYPDETIKKYVRGSLRKYLRKYRLDLSNPVEHDLYIEFLQSAIMILYACQEMIKTKSLRCIVTQEESYIQGGIPVEVGKSANIDTYIQGGGYHEGTLTFGRGQNVSPRKNFCDTDLITEIMRTELCESEKQKVADIMKKRQHNQNTNLEYAVQNGKKYDTSKSTTVGVFSHLLWDGAIEPNEGLYSDFYTWLEDTISAGENMNNIEFVIKAHPAEEMRATNELLEDWLNENYNTLPDNFSFLPPDTDVNTYQLFSQLDAGVVFASTVGLEMAYSGIPVIVGGFPPYHGREFTFTPDTKTEYKQLIRKITTLNCNDEMQERAARFAHFLFRCQHIDFPYEHGNNSMSSSEEGVVIEHDEIAREEGICQEIVNQMLHGEDVLDPSCRIGHTGY